MSDRFVQSIAVCIAVFNRREKTLRCLSQLFTAQLPPGSSLTVHLLDDASTDGTGEAVRSQFPQVHFHEGDGNFFWAGGMRMAFGAALAEVHDYYVWLNDDVDLFPDAIARALKVSEELKTQYGGEHLLVGAMRARDEDSMTYSGLGRSSRFLPWKFAKLDPFLDRPRKCLTLNGNFVFIPASLARKLGNIPLGYIQMHADFDLGLRARRMGANTWILPGFVGICDANVGGRYDYKAPGLRFKERVRLIGHPLGYPLRANIAYARNFGLWAPIMIVAPYLNLLKSTVSHWLRERS